MKYLILLILAISLVIPTTTKADGYADNYCECLRAAMQYHLDNSERAGIDVNISIAESLKAINYLILYQIHGCQNATCEKPFILPSVSFDYSRPKIRLPNLEIKPGPFGHGKSYEIRENSYRK